MLKVKKIISITLSFLILFGNMGFIVATHYCGEYMVSSELTIGDKHVDCGMEDMTSSCDDESSTHDVTISKTCCENEYKSLQIDDDYQKVIAQTGIDYKFVYAFVYTFLPAHVSEKSTSTAFSERPPTLLKQSLQVLFQTFLI